MAVNVAVVGATGAVGQTIIEILEERAFPVDQIYALGSSRSAGSTVLFKGKPIQVQNLAEFDFSSATLALFSAGGSVSAEFAPKAVESGCVVVDNTSHFRNVTEVPLVVPEVNIHTLNAHSGIIAVPNCSTIQMVVALKPIYDAVGISRINVATYQSVSGAGKRAIEELAAQTTSLLSGKKPVVEIMAKQIAFNVIPEIDTFQENGYTREEMKMVWETQKILEDTDIRVNATAVRVPVFYCHSEAIHLETCDKIDAAQVIELLSIAPGVTVIDERTPGGYPTAVTDGSGTDAVYVGRIREDISSINGINMWVVSDNIRKGAALNSVQIAEALLPTL
ncbi:MAG: aspartate-semialdehyde dehydrogenase [Acidiferrobacteraceae bacterium]|nr:aspartate-semialdehyde dehydrogenase [Acidiferrobacteraceae bacterium]